MKINKYKKLKEYFQRLEKTRVRLTYSKITMIIEESLPPSSYLYKAWWSNGGHEHAEAWLDSGWKVDDISLGNWVDFVKESNSSSKELIYNKLVRDAIPKIIEGSGRKCEIRIACNDEKLKLLKDKLQEEVKEFLHDSNLEELADVMEVLIGLANNLGYSEEDLIKKRNEKREEKGGFEDGIVLIKTFESEN